MPTATITSTPWNQYCQAWESWRNVVTLSSCSTSTAPNSAPMKDPRPPKMLVPPSTTAVTEASV